MKEKLIELSEKIAGLGEAINATQKKFLEEITKEELEGKAIAVLLNNTELYSNTGISPIKLENKQNNMTSDETSNKEDDIKAKSIKTPTAPLGVLYYWVELKEEELDIDINMMNVKQPLPNEVNSFIQESYKVVNAITELFKGDEALRWLRNLEGIVRAGGTSTYILLAQTQLEGFKKELALSNGNELKFNYLKQSGKYVFYLIASCLFFLLLLKKFDTQIYKLDLVNPVYAINYLFVIIGTGIGSWLIFAITKREVTFDDLRILGKNKYLPALKLAVIVLISTAFFFMFLTDFVNIKIGDKFNTALLTERESKNIAFIIGMFLGLSENTIGTKLTTKVESFITKL